jgi:hypothetical protein
LWRDLKGRQARPFKRRFVIADIYNIKRAHRILVKRTVRKIHHVRKLEFVIDNRRFDWQIELAIGRGELDEIIVRFLSLIESIPIEAHMSDGTECDGKRPVHSRRQRFRFGKFH